MAIYSYFSNLVIYHMTHHGIKIILWYTHTHTHTHTHTVALRLEAIMSVVSTRQPGLLAGRHGSSTGSPSWLEFSYGSSSSSVVKLDGLFP